MYFYVTKAFREAHISSSETGSWNFQTGVIIGTFRAAFLTLKRVVLCGRCSSGSQRETGSVWKSSSKMLAHFTMFE